MSVEGLISDANLLVAGAVAFAAGVVSFASPCVVPLVPGYLSYMTGLSGAELRQEAGQSARGRARVIAGGLLFTLGFAVPFTLLGVVGGTLAVALSSVAWRVALGLMVMALGIAFTGLLPFDFLRREARFTDSAIDKGLLGALPLGFVFGVGWTPCIGPALGAILTLGVIGSGDNPARGALLAFVYALGLGLPFILLGVLFHRAGRALGFLRRNARGFQVAGGLLLAGVGLSIATGLWEAFITWLLPVVGRFETAL